MTSCIASTFARLKAENRAALIPYLTVGYPSLEATRALLRVISEQGADIMELGVPFSDPLADGATIQRASHAALQNGVSLADCLAVAAEFREHTQQAVVGARHASPLRLPADQVPLIFMSYYNPIHKYGTRNFALDCAACGVDGLIIPDLPPEEASGLKTACQQAGVELIFLLAPSSTDERIERVVDMAGGFIYCVSLTGVTGARTNVDESAAALVARVRRYTGLPLAVGFGISTPEQVAGVAQFADGVVVGSALINLIESLPEDWLADGVSEYVRSLSQATERQPAASALPLNQS
ncbi:MAG: tryptophan synthase subunit alpha [Chloroflexia bacterium]